MRPDELIETEEEVFIPIRRPVLKKAGRAPAGDKKARARKFSERQMEAARRYQEKRRKTLRTQARIGRKIKKVLKHLPPRMLRSFQEKLQTFRLAVIRRWRKSDRYPFCEFHGCRNLPGQDGFKKQVDHILDRGRWKDLVFDPENGVVSCGQHEYLTFMPDTSKRSPESMLEIIRKELPDRYAYAQIELVKSGRL